MPGESRGGDERGMWQSQPGEALKMSAEIMRRRAKSLQSRARISVMISTVIGVGLCAVFGWEFARSHSVMERIGLGILCVWAAYSVYLAYRWVWPKNIVPRAAVDPSLEFYKRELERQRDHVQNLWRRAGLTYCFIGLAFVVGPAVVEVIRARAEVMQILPFFVLLATWGVLFYFLKNKKRRRLQRLIDELKSYERAAGG
jgi:hypothetical protein